MELDMIGINVGEMKFWLDSTTVVRDDLTQAEAYSLYSKAMGNGELAKEKYKLQVTLDERIKMTALLVAYNTIAEKAHNVFKQRVLETVPA
jgi:hypothetical protein